MNDYICGTLCWGHIVSTNRKTKADRDALWYRHFVELENLGLEILSAGSELMGFTTIVCIEKSVRSVSLGAQAIIIQPEEPEWRAIIVEALKLLGIEVMHPRIGWVLSSYLGS